MEHEAKDRVEIEKQNEAAIEHDVEMEDHQEIVSPPQQSNKGRLNGIKRKITKKSKNKKRVYKKFEEAELTVLKGGIFLVKLKNKYKIFKYII